MTLLLMAAFALAVVLGAILWNALGQPDLTGAGAWTAQHTFDAAKIILLVVGGVGGVVALTVSYRKQDLGEAAQAREEARLLAERFRSAAEQLGSERAAVRLAGVYAMVHLADEWTEERQMCIDVLCAYMRMPYVTPEWLTRVEHPQDDYARFKELVIAPTEEQQVRQTIVELIARHLRVHAEVSWHENRFDFTGAVIAGGDFRGIEVKPGTLLDFSGAYFPEGVLDFTDSAFKGGRVNFDRIVLDRGGIVFHGCEFFDSVSPGAKVSFDDATLSKGAMYFTGADLVKGTISFQRTHCVDALVAFNGCRFTYGSVSFSEAILSGGTIDFAGSVLTHGSIIVMNSRFCGAEVNFADAEIRGGRVEITTPTDWSVPPTGLDTSHANVLVAGLPAPPENPN